MVTHAEETNPYRVEYAKSGRSMCTLCKSFIANRELRLGSPVEFHESISYKWRHWHCLTDRVLSNMMAKINRRGLYEAVSGLEDLSQEDRDRVLEPLATGVREQKETEPKATAGVQEEAAAAPLKVQSDAKEEAPAPAVRTPAKRGRPKSSKPKNEGVKEETVAKVKKKFDDDFEWDEEWQPRKESRSVRTARRLARVKAEAV